MRIGRVQVNMRLASHNPLFQGGRQEDVLVRCSGAGGAVLRAVRGMRLLPESRLVAPALRPVVAGDVVGAAPDLGFS